MHKTRNILGHVYMVAFLLYLLVPLLVPSLLGSTTSGWFTQTIQSVMLEEQDWNTGAAFAFMLLIVCTLAVSFAMWAFRVKLSDIAK